MFQKKREEHRDTQGEKSHIKMEAEVRLMPPQAKEHLEPPEVGRDKEGLVIP